MMEVEKMSRDIAINKIHVDNYNNDDKDHEDNDFPLPGFRFHPTDEELVGFYLRREVEKRPISIQLIKHIDIYKFDPWDLPSSNVGDKELYFFCKRGRKYKNSIRPNRVTGSGFWKATGIDKPIYSAGSIGRECIIGLKKSLVYYRGFAGKGTKTDWMMHEFRLPPHHSKTTTIAPHNTTNNIAQEAEVWTLCRIFKRNISYRKCIPDWRELSAKRNIPIDASSKPCSTMEFSAKPCSTMEFSDNRDGYISFRAPLNRESEKLEVDCEINQLLVGQLSSNSQAPSTTPSYSSFFSKDINEIIKYGDWEDLRYVVDDPFLL